MTGQGSRYGYFGKLPFAGDFLRRGLSPEFIAGWDGWMQRVMTTARDSLGEERWTEAYPGAPIWRFFLAPGLCGPRGAAGIVMPGLDRVGRRFPFCIVTETDLPPLAANLALQPVVERLEEAALAMIEDDATLADLDARLARLSGPVLVGGAEHLGKACGSLWVAVAADQARVLVAPDLPEDAARAAALFDLDAPYWTGRAVGNPED